MPNKNAIAVYASAARSAAPTPVDYQNTRRDRGLLVVLDLTAFTTAASLTVIVEGKDPVSGKYFTLLTGAAVVASSTVVYRIYPGLTAVANLTVSDVLPAAWRVRVTHGNGNSHTYSVSAMPIV